MTKLKIRIALAINADGEWRAFGEIDYTQDEMLDRAKIGVSHPLAIHWIEADVPLPQPQTIKGKIRKVKK